LPATALAFALPTLGASLWLLLGYPVSAGRIYHRHRRRGRAPRDAALGAFFTTLGKLPEMQGVLRFHRDRLRGAKGAIIEYKRAG
jgi:hypothetical protein